VILQFRNSRGVEVRLLFNENLGFTEIHLSW
jgi:hypothetical protein